MSRLRIAAAAALCALLGGVVYASDDPFLMVSGSESTSLVVAPAAAVQAAGVLIFAVCLLAPTRHRMRAGLAVAAAAAALLASHRLVIDNLRGEIRDVYLLTSVQRLSLDQALEGGLSARLDAAGARVGQVGAAPSIWVLSPPVVGLDRAALARVAG